MDIDQSGLSERSVKALRAAKVKTIEEFLSWGEVAVLKTSYGTAHCCSELYERIARQLWDRYARWSCKK